MILFESSHQKDLLADFLQFFILKSHNLQNNPITFSIAFVIFSSTSRILLVIVVKKKFSLFVEFEGNDNLHGILPFSLD